jgi:hypothetical protein
MPMYYSLPVYAILLCSSWPVLLYASDSEHRLVAGKPLSPGSVLISEDGVFALGFFSPSSNSTKNHSYVGIWYNSIPEFTVVRVSNRAAPITDLSSANLAVTSSSKPSYLTATVMFFGQRTTASASSIPPSRQKPCWTTPETSSFVQRLLLAPCYGRALTTPLTLSFQALILGSATRCTHCSASSLGKVNRTHPPASSPTVQTLTTSCSASSGMVQHRAGEARCGQTTSFV